jgi:hypothetical protein
VGTVEDFFDLRIETIRPRAEPESDAHIVRIENPAPAEVARRVAEGWYHRPTWVTYAIAVPQSLDEYIERSFSSRQRNKPRKLLRDVPKRYRFTTEEIDGHPSEFHALYRRTVVGKPRGRDRVSEHGAFGRGWTGFYLRDGDKLVAGVLVHEMLRHLSVAYGAFDPERRRELDLEHFLLMQVLERSIAKRHRALSLGMDTNRYGHHLSLRLPAYKLRIGFTPLAHEPGGRELTLFRRFDPFEEGLFFYAYPTPPATGADDGGLVGHFFARGEPDLRPFRHHNAPPVEVHAIPREPTARTVSS